MTRTFAGRIVDLMLHHAASEKYPTRSVEYMLAWMMIGLSATLFLPSGTLRGTQFESLLLFASQSTWAICGMFLGTMRIGALILNGSWKRSPILRLIGASAGFQFWAIITALNVFNVLHNSAFVFPILGAFPAIVFFEAYSCFRCGQDARRAAAR